MSRIESPGHGSLDNLHTDPMNFLNKIPGLPAHENPFLLLVVSLPAADVRVPATSRKQPDRIAAIHTSSPLQGTTSAGHAEP